jgi:hypothetical protein
VKQSLTGGLQNTLQNAELPPRFVNDFNGNGGIGGFLSTAPATAIRMSAAPFSPFAALTKSGRQTKGPSTLLGQSHNSLNGGSLVHGGMDELMPPAPPLDADTPLDPDRLLNVDTPRDP